MKMSLQDIKINKTPGYFNFNCCSLKENEINLDVAEFSQV